MSSKTAVRPFRYEGVGRSGALDHGEILSFSEEEVARRLRGLGVRPLSIKPGRTPLLQRELAIPGLGPRINQAELAVVARQFATMINAGIPLIRCLDVLQDQSDNPLLKQTLNEIKGSVASGDSLSSALRRHPKVFDHLFVSMVSAGEAGGALDTVLLQLAGAMERSVAIRRKIRSAMSYPIAVLFMVVLVVLAMLIFVVPVFTDIYADFGGQLPLPTRVLVAVSEVLTKRLPFVAVGVVLVVVGFRKWKDTAKGHHQWDAMKLRLPLVGPLLHKTAIARAGRTLAVLTRAGVPVLETLRIASETTGNAVVTDALIDTIAGVSGGERMADNLRRHAVFPSMVVQLVTVGEETGSLDDMLEIVGVTFEDEVETAVAGFAALIEPLLMALIGGVVGAMVVSLYLPMFRIIELVQ